MSDFNTIRTIQLAAVLGGQAIPFDQNPSGAVKQVHDRIATCRALAAERLRLNPRGITHSDTDESAAFHGQAQQCWKSLRGE